jgi:hypothetical protein
MKFRLPPSSSHRFLKYAQHVMLMNTLVSHPHALVCFVSWRHSVNSLLVKWLVFMRQESGPVIMRLYAPFFSMLLVKLWLTPCVLLPNGTILCHKVVEYMTNADPTSQLVTSFDGMKQLELIRFLLILSHGEG